jgi:hypothetical protein
MLMRPFNFCKKEPEKAEKERKSPVLLRKIAYPAHATGWEHYFYPHSGSEEHHSSTQFYM